MTAYQITLDKLWLLHNWLLTIAILVQITLDKLWLLHNWLLTIAIKQGLDYGFFYNTKCCEKNSSYMYSNLKRLNLLENWFYDLGFLEKQIGNGTRIPFVHYKQVHYVWTDKL